MDRNLFLAVSLSIAVLMLWSVFQAPPPSRQGSGSGGTVESPGGEAARGTTPAGEIPPPPAMEAVPVPDLLAEEAAEPPPPSAGARPEVFRIERSSYLAELTSEGAALRSWELTGYYEDAKRREHRIGLVTGLAPHAEALVTPFSELGLGDLSRAVFSVEEASNDRYAFVYTLNGVKVRKIYAFDPAGGGEFGFRLSVEISNGSGSAVEPQFAVRWPAHIDPAADYREQGLVALHDGSVVKQPLQTLGKSGFLGSLTGGRPQLVHDYPGEVDWVGMQTTYFLGVVVPDDPARARARLIATAPGEAGIAEIYFPPVSLPPGRSVTHEFRGYAGPKEPKALEAFGAETVRSIDLGWTWVSPLTRFFGSLLHMIHEVIPNYGVAIILLTILVRAVTLPLTQKQMRSMERMRALQPKMKEIQEKYADDRQKQSEAVMSLYRTEKVNPLGGCLPMILQLPVFIGLFYALRSSIQLRQAPFVAWIDDLSAPENFFDIPGIGIPVRVLPLLMGVSMFFQQKITPMQMDPAQAKMMTTIMPVMMTVLFYRFPSGLVLYWMVSNVLAISHQIWVGRGMKKKQG